jgi:hypothetical protein
MTPPGSAPPADSLRTARQLLTTEGRKIANANPSRRSIAIQNVSATVDLVAWVGDAGCLIPGAGSVDGAIRLVRFDMLVYDHKDAVYARPDTSDGATLSVQEENYET